MIPMSREKTSEPYSKIKRDNIENSLNFWYNNYKSRG